MIKTILSYVFGVLMIAGAAGHILSPDFYEAMIPGFISPTFANILAAIVEGAVGALLFIPKYRHWGGLGFSVLMLAFLPLHQTPLALGGRTACAFVVAIRVARLFARQVLRVREWRRLLPMSVAYLRVAGALQAP